MGDIYNNPIDANELREAIEHVERRWRWCAHEDDMRQLVLLTAARAHLATLPKTKMVEVWHVEYAVWSLGYWQPRIKEAVSLKEAQGVATGIRSLNDRTCIRVTGPFQQEVPS